MMAVNETQLDEQFLMIIYVPQDIFIVSRKLDVDPNLYQKGMRVLTTQVERPHPLVKSIEARALSAKALEQAKKRGFDEVILVDQRRNCTEGAYSNLFWVRDGQIFTNQENALAGITQQAIVEMSAKTNPIRTHILSQEDIWFQDELFLTSSKIGVMPVVRVDETDIGDGKPGPIKKKIMKAFADLTKKECSADTTSLLK